MAAALRPLSVELQTREGGQLPQHTECQVDAGVIAGRPRHLQAQMRHMDVQPLAQLLQCPAMKGWDVEEAQQQ